jgi:hypothetical protein
MMALMMDEVEAVQGDDGVAEGLPDLVEVASE